MVVTVALVALASSCGSESNDQSQDDPTQDPDPQAVEETGDTDPAAGDTAEPGSPGTLDNPTPEPSGTLPSNGFRIGDNAWARTVPITRGQCFVQEGEGVLPFAVWGTLDNDDGLSFAVSIGEDDAFSSEVTSDTMFWVAGQRVGSQLSVTHDLTTQTISGEGIFNNLQSNEWAHGSFAFTCTAN